jgi:putative transposase
MARSIRICRPNATYHCYSRCIEKRNMLSSCYVQDIAVIVVKKALSIYDFKLIQLEFVGNHFHILIQTTANGQTISRILQYIKARITERYNKLTNRTGTMWNERFKSKIIEEAEDPIHYFLYLMWYIAYNPVRKGIIKNPRESKLGTIRVYLEYDYKAKVPITLHDYFLNLGANFKERVRCFLQYEDLYQARLAMTTGA